MFPVAVAVGFYAYMYPTHPGAMFCHLLRKQTYVLSKILTISKTSRVFPKFWFPPEILISPQFFCSFLPNFEFDPKPVAWAPDTSTSCLDTWYHFLGHLILVAWAPDTSCLWVLAGVLEPTPQRRKLWSLHLAGYTAAYQACMHKFLYFMQKFL